MGIQNSSTTCTPSKYNQVQNVNTVQWESGNVTTKPWEINNRKSEVVAFVVNAGMNVTAKFFIFKCKKELSLSEVFAYLTEVLLDKNQEYVS